MNEENWSSNIRDHREREQVASCVLAEKSRTVLVPIDQLRPHEKGSPLYLELLKQEILRDGMLRYPIIADEKTRVILDGTHRWLALKSLGYTLIPVTLVDAFQNPRIRVGRRRIHQYTGNSNGEITEKEVISAGLSGSLMKPRSTRHFFPFSKFLQINYPLGSLKKRASEDVSNYLARMSRKECDEVIKGWFEEINEELEFLTRKKEEVEKEKEEMLYRLKLSEKNSPV